MNLICNSVEYVSGKLPSQRHHQNLEILSVRASSVPGAWIPYRLLTPYLQPLPFITYRSLCVLLADTAIDPYVSRLFLDLLDTELTRGQCQLDCSPRPSLYNPP